MYLLGFVENFSCCEKIITDKLWNKTVIIKIGFYFIIPMTEHWLVDWIFSVQSFSRHNTEKVVYFLLLDRKLRNPSIEDDHEIRLRSESGNYSALRNQMIFLRLSRDIYFQVYYKYLLK